VGGLAHFFEDEGVATAQISLIRLHTEKVRPPRALWVPFELGRPLGAPGDAEFQKRVLRAVLRLFEREDGPVILEDFDEEAPLVAAGGQEIEGWACPISLPPPPEDLAAGGGYRAVLKAEVARLAPWYDIALRERGRSAVGLSGLDMNEAVDLVSGVLDGETPQSPLDGVGGAEFLKFAIDDLKAFYREAAAVQPGANTGQAVNDWFYGETVAGNALMALRPILIDLGKRLDDSFMTTFGVGLLIPQTQKHRLPR
jgi:hypothetical protein